MKFLRKVRNDDIREVLGVIAVIKHIQNNQMKWFSHLSRMLNERPADMISG